MHKNVMVFLKVHNEGIRRHVHKYVENVEKRTKWCINSCKETLERNNTAWNTVQKIT